MKILRARHTVIVDAAFLKRDQRAPLRAAAEQAGAPFVILDIHAPDDILRERLRQRALQNQEVSEADLAVLDHQLATQEPLTADEQAATLIVDSGISPDITALVQKLRALTAAG